MRILAVSNFYPPLYIGGYELACQEAVQGLRARGHEVRILTSTYGIGHKASEASGCHRLLEADLNWKQTGFLARNIRLLHQELRNRAAFKGFVKRFDPDVIYLWNLNHVSLSIAQMAQTWGIPISWYVFDNWLASWEEDRWYSLWHGPTDIPYHDLIRRLLFPFLKLLGIAPPRDALDLRGAQFASQYLKHFALQKGKNVETAEVIPWGIEENHFPFFLRRRKPQRLLYVGQIMPHKGVHTAIYALKMIEDESERRTIHLTLAGGTINPKYKNSLQQLVLELRLEHFVNFAGFVPHEELPRIYREHDILVFPSLWDEPFGITLIEAMSSGLPVVATATGGSAEFLVHEVNALVFQREDAQACAQQISRLTNDSTLFNRLSINAKSLVDDKFRLQTTLDRIENSLFKIARKGRSFKKSKGGLRR